MQKIQESQMNSVNALFDRPATQQSARSTCSERPESSANTQTRTTGEEDLKRKTERKRTKNEE